MHQKTEKQGKNDYDADDVYEQEHTSVSMVYIYAGIALEILHQK